MTAPAAFQATYSDWRLVKGRKVVQVVFEIPLEDANKAYDVLGGMPDPSKSVWCGIARLKHEGGANQQFPNSDPTRNEAPRSPTTEGGARKRDWNELSPAQQTGMLCHDPTFVRFLIEEIEHDFSVTCPEDAATIVRQQCGVKTRADIVPGTDAATKWSRLYGRFLAWKIAA